MQFIDFLSSRIKNAQNQCSNMSNFLAITSQNCSIVLNLSAATYGSACVKGAIIAGGGTGFCIMSPT